MTSGMESPIATALSEMLRSWHRCSIAYTMAIKYLQQKKAKKSVNSTTISGALEAQQAKLENICA